ncbi:uncharacterized protein LOC134278518 [Saccostrea cucullata]|uniref:uncharacterized protein LOC134240380 n=1 Tax=Saccostrea cuccullata TaxID=36930 RepID=UPI002ED66E0B
MQFSLIFIVIFTIFRAESDAWWIKKPCQYKVGASAYYFGTTNLSCMIRKVLKGKRSAPQRNNREFSHRFIYYQGKYFDFMDTSKVYISNSRFYGDRCSGGIENNPAGYSTLSLSCIEGCARNYRCKYGKYKLFRNNCHDFANRMSQILCKNGSDCPTWCLGSCNDAEYNY